MKINHENKARREATPCATMHHDLRRQFMLLAFMLFWYGFILFYPPPRDPYCLTFNSMLSHMLHGRFDVDPGIVGAEGFLRNGRVYAYWGIWGALLRLPLWLVGRMDFDLTRGSCLAAVCVAAMAKVRTVHLLRRHGAQDATARHATNMMLAYIVLGGSAVGYLRATIYQEVVFWAVAFAAVFVYFAMKGIVLQRFDHGTLNAMALCAGLALLTRVSTAIGLFLAFGLLLAVLAGSTGRTHEIPLRQAIAHRLKSLFQRRFLLPWGILACFSFVTGAINDARWGNPLVFADFKYYLSNVQYPDRALREAAYGMFHLSRIPFGLMYYFFPVWAMRTGGHHLLFEASLTRLFDDVELPPSTLLLTDLLPLGFTAFLLAALRMRRTERLQPMRIWAAIAVGLSAPCVLILAYVSLTYRYRMEFYPEIDFLAFLGLYLILTEEKIRAIYVRRRLWIEGALIVSVASSFASFLLYFLSPFGPAHDLFYRGLTHGGRFLWF